MSKVLSIVLTDPSTPTPTFRNAALRATAIIYLLHPLLWGAIETRVASRYSPFYSFSSYMISDLAVPYPFQRHNWLDYSPFAWLMNANFLLTALLYAVPQWLLLYATRGRHSVADHLLRAARMLTTALFVMGLTAVAAVHGGPREHADGSVKYHEMGAVTSITCGNLLSVLTGLTEGQLSPVKASTSYRLMSSLVGVAGLLFGLSTITIATPANVGTIERLSVYSIFAWESLTSLLLLKGLGEPVKLLLGSGKHQ